MTRGEYVNTPLVFGEKGIFCKGIDIMCSWEKAVIQKSVDEICQRVKPKSVLEVGYGYGWTAERFQANGVEKHVVVEPHPDIIKRISVEEKSKFILIEDFIQNCSFDEEFDLIYNDILDPSITEGNQQDVRFFHTFRYRFYAQMFSDNRIGEGFMFEADGKMWFQSLIKNPYGGS